MWYTVPMDTDFIYLAILFFSSGLLSIAYYSTVPDREELKRRLPNRVSLAAVVLGMIMLGLAWYVISSFDGLQRASRIFMLLFGLLVFESCFIFLMRWIKIQLANVIVSLAIPATLTMMYFRDPSFGILNAIILLAMFGAATLLIRMDYLRTKILFLLTGFWVVYDIVFVTYILPRFTSPTAQPFPTFLYPAVRVGDISLGSGDFMFLTLFTLVLLRDFGPRIAISVVLLEALSLVVTGWAVGDGEVLLPFLVVMAPIFAIGYAVAHIFHRRKGIAPHIRRDTAIG